MKNVNREPKINGGDPNIRKEEDNDLALCHDG